MSKPSLRRSAPRGSSWPRMKAPPARASECAAMTPLHRIRKHCIQLLCCLFYFFMHLPLLPKHPKRTQPKPTGAQPPYSSVHRQPASPKRHFYYHPHHSSPDPKAPAPPRYGLHFLPVAVTEALYQEHVRRRPSS